MAPALTSQPAEKQAQCNRSPCPRRIARTFAELLKSNLKNLLADCSGQPAARGASVHPPAWQDMKHALGQLCKPSVMDSAQYDKDSDVMGLHSVNSQSLQELILSRKELAESLAAAASSPPPDLAEVMRELDGERTCAPHAGGNGDVLVDGASLVAQLAAGAEPEPPPPPAPAPPPPPVVVELAPAAPMMVAAVTPTVSVAEQVRGRQRELEGRLVVLMRRLRTLQTRSARHQTTANSRALLDKLSSAQNAPSSAVTAHNSDIAAVLRSPDAKHFSTTQLVNLVLNNKPSSVASASVSTAEDGDGEPSPSAAARLAREAAAAACARPAGAAAAQLRRLAGAEDPDATDSSSGGESADEFDTGWDDAAPGRAPPIRKRALWRWLSDRSAVGSRWCWLAAQVTDLEFRIRQLRQLHRQLRAARHPTGAGADCSSTAARQAAADALGGAGDACSGATVLRLAGKLAATGGGATAVADDGQCARTRASALSKQRRRLVSVWRSARRPPPPLAARCRCDPGAQSCATCAGRVDYLPRLSADTQPLRERRARLRPGWHPVLSLPGDAPPTLAYDALLRSHRWQQNHLPPRSRVASQAAAAASQQETASSSTSSSGAAAHPQPGAAAAAAHTVTRPSYHRRRPGVLKRLPEVDSDGELSLPTHPTSAPPQPASHARLGRPPKSARRSRSTSASAPPPPPPPPPPPTLVTEEELRSSALQRYRQRQQSYDIDNIVIPASMASTTKIEKPKYKDIITPGWRLVELEPAEVKVNGSGLGSWSREPLDDASFERRHWRAELAERQRLYQNCQVAPLSGDSSGRGRRAHTPDTAAAASRESGASAGAPVDTSGRQRLLRYHHVQQPCGFPSRRFPLSDTEWQSLLTLSEEADPSPVGWRSPASPTGSSTESAPEADDSRRTAAHPHPRK